MPQILALSQLTSGQSAVIQRVCTTGAIYERLYDLGFTPGAAVVCLFASVFGDPRAYRIKGTTVALRQADAAGIECSLCGGER